jgi:hypothetical protein
MGFVQVKAQMLKNIFTVVPTLLKLLGSMAHNVHGFASGGDLELRLPGRPAVKKRNF